MATYQSPGVRVSTTIETVSAANVAGARVPYFIGEAQEELFQADFQVVRGSSATVDQQIVKEDETSRAVSQITATGQVVLAPFDGTLTRFQVRHYPITTGDGSGTTSTNRSSVEVLVDGEAYFVKSVDGAKGVVELTQAPPANSLVECTYSFNRTDTQVTENLSFQIDKTSAELFSAKGVADVNSAASTGEVLEFYDDVLDGSGNVITPANNVFTFVVDGVSYTRVITPKVDYTVSQLVNFFNSLQLGSLTASSFLTNEGKSAIKLTADKEIEVREGSANSVLGFSTGDRTTRTKTFYTNQRPIVDGSNQGLATTNPADIDVRINGVKVVPVSVNGQVGTFTLSVAPKSTDKLEVTYFFNAWQDTFDYLGHKDVLSISQVGDVPGVAEYLQGTDFVLDGDTIHWGTSKSLSDLELTEGAASLTTKTTLSLIDNQYFMQPCTRVSSTQFLLAENPTLGDGRGSTISASIFAQLRNSRIDVQSSRPDLVKVFWGYDPQDALDRGAVTVKKIEGAVITLGSAIPPGASVYANFYYSKIEDAVYTIKVKTEGASGAGSYEILDAEGVKVIGPTFDPTSKGSNLNGVTLEFPSGSERSPDLRYEEGTLGPVLETVTVQFKSREATPAKYTTPGFSPYAFITKESDRIRLAVDGADLDVGTAGLSLSDPSGHGNGFFAHLVSDPIVYTGGTNATVGATYTLSSVEALNLELDGEDVEVLVDAKENVSITHFAARINEVVSGSQNVAAGGGAATITLAAAHASNQDDFYVGWKVVIGNGADAATAGQVREITDYNGTTRVATVSQAWAGDAVAADDPYFLYNPATLAKMVGASTFDASITIEAGDHDDLNVRYIGDNSGTHTIEATLDPGTYTPSQLAAEVATQINDAFTALGEADLAGLLVFVTVNTDNQLVFSVQLPGIDSAGALHFLDDVDESTDFGVIVGLSGSSGAHAALVQAPIARSIRTVGATGKYLYDRLILRNRVLPGNWRRARAQSGLTIKAGSGNTKAGLVVGSFAEAGSEAVVTPAELGLSVDFANGLLNGDCTVTFYDGTGARPANNTLTLLLDGVVCDVEFTADADGVQTEFGPVSDNTTVLGQIAHALSTLPDTPFGDFAACSALIHREGNKAYLSSPRHDVLSSVVVDGGLALSVLGLQEGVVRQRSLVSVEKLVSALMDYRQETFSTYLLSPSTITGDTFADVAIAAPISDLSGLKYLYLESLTTGGASSLEWRDATVGGVVTNDAKYRGTGLNVPSSASETGESALDGFVVTSTNASGSGSANTSVFNSGTGQDGVVGQTYRDTVTGLTFTILPRGYHEDPDGPWLAYPTGETARFRIECKDSFIADSTKAHNLINGATLRVDNTVGTEVGDTITARTFAKSGAEPQNGEPYYVSYTYRKSDFLPQVFNDFSAVVDEYGPLSTTNPLTLAAYLAFVNGAPFVGLKQVPRDSTGSASLESYIEAVEDLEGVLDVPPSIIVPLRGDSLELFQLLKKSNNLMSSERYKLERTSIVGLSGGSNPDRAKEVARALSSSRMVLVYPDVATFELTNQDGTVTEELIEGPFIAAALAGAVTSASVDVATPWTRRQLRGIRRLARRLRAPDQDRIAATGVTLLEEVDGIIRVRDGLTTDRSSKLAELPAVQLIQDEMQKRARRVLDRYIGTKFLPTILPEVEGTLAEMAKRAQREQIIVDFRSIRAVSSADDPTKLEGYMVYSPVVGLKEIVLRFNMRARLN